MVPTSSPIVALSAETSVRCALPAAPLRTWIDHYWLSLDNDSPAHAILPDGAIDLVVRQGPESDSDWTVRVYGTTTSSLSIALEQGAHYAGVRFKPGQGRHFLKAAARELTDRCESATGLLPFCLDRVAGHVGSADIFASFDAVLLAHAASVQPLPARIDSAVALIAASRGMLSIEDAADAFGTGRRQFERVFLDTVGIAPKLFSSIVRFHCAGRLIRQAPAARMTLADIAHACGYADQSHMNRDFRRLAGMAPSAFVRGNVAFVQDAAAPPPDNTPACSTHPGEWK